MAKTYRAILVGAGNMGRAWAKALTECDQTQISAWVDILPDVAAKTADELKIDTLTTTDLEQAIRDTKADFVVDVSIPEAHKPVTLQALEAGLPVIGEKPMAESMESARAMVAASEKTGLLYMVSQSRRYNAMLVTYRDLIRANIGQVGILNADFYLGPRIEGFRKHMPSPLVLDMAIHTFDAARYITGADPVSVICDEFNPAWSWFDNAACATALFEMEGGIRFTYRGSWVAEGRGTSWDSEWRAVGEHGTMVWDGTNPAHGDVFESITSGDSWAKTIPVTAEVPKIYEGIDGSLREFLHALETGVTPQGECHDNIKSLAMVFAAMESARSGSRVKVLP